MHFIFNPRFTPDVPYEWFMHEQYPEDPWPFFTVSGDGYQADSALLIYTEMLQDPDEFVRRYRELCLKVLASRVRGELQRFEAMGHPVSLAKVEVKRWNFSRPDSRYCDCIGYSVLFKSIVVDAPEFEFMDVGVQMPSDSDPYPRDAEGRNVVYMDYLYFNIGQLIMAYPDFNPDHSPTEFSLDALPW